MKVLENYSWPGNIRELINVVERAVIESDSPELCLADKIDALPSDPLPEEMSMNHKERERKGLFEVEREHILVTLQEKGWIIEGHKGAAQLLGINPSTLRSRMKKLGIARPAAL